ncbi:2-oxo-4-hydroxy-4-carboxy-5-ureidoimidazoline decarboxylase [Balamuthia mandrillaris]
MAGKGLVAIEKLNGLNRGEFFKVVDLLFESAPPLADALFSSRPFGSYEEIIDRAEALISSFDHPTRLQVINAHPRIGADPSTLSAQSLKEQGYDVSDPTRLAEELKAQRSVLEELAVENQNYERKYGFKFVVFVNGRSKKKILGVLKERLHRTTSEEAELALGLSEMMAIARDRLRKFQRSSTVATASQANVAKAQGSCGGNTVVDCLNAHGARCITMADQSNTNEEDGSSDGQEEDGEQEGICDCLIGWKACLAGCSLAGAFMDTCVASGCGEQVQCSQDSQSGEDSGAAVFASPLLRWSI